MKDHDPLYSIVDTDDIDHDDLGEGVRMMLFVWLTDDPDGVERWHATAPDIEGVEGVARSPGRACQNLLALLQLAGAWGGVGGDAAVG